MLEVKITQPRIELGFNGYEPFVFTFILLSVDLAHVVGIEPTPRGLEALVLPLHQTCMLRSAGIEPALFK